MKWATGFKSYTHYPIIIKITFIHTIQKFGRAGNWSLYIDFCQFRQFSLIKIIVENFIFYSLFVCHSMALGNFRTINEVIKSLWTNGIKKSKRLTDDNQFTFERSFCGLNDSCLNIILKETFLSNEKHVAMMNHGTLKSSVIHSAVVQWKKHLKMPNKHIKTKLERRVVLHWIKRNFKLMAVLLRFAKLPEKTI